MGEEVDFCVPTGNFGNILAGYYAKMMGLPVGKLVCASNKNNVLTDFFATGKYDTKRDFYKTESPSMDILISSNLERLIFEMSGRNAELTAKRMEDLSKSKEYQVSDLERVKIGKQFGAGYTDEKNCKNTIKEFFDDYGYALDTHTGVAMSVANANLSENPMVVLSTASPYKFPASVYEAITGKKETDAFTASKKLEYTTAYPVPEQISLLKEKEVRFTKVIDKENILDTVLEFVKK